MPFAVRFKKWFPLVVLAGVAGAAYFQAVGVMQLVAAALTPSGAAVPAPPPPIARAAPEPKSADAILARNPFDSVTGPLDAKPIDTMVPKASELDTTEPLSAPTCKQTQVSIVTESDDPTWSVAELQGPGEPQAHMRRVGDEVGGMQVAFIGYNPKENTPAVWLVDGSTLCQAMLFNQEEEVEKAPARPPLAPRPQAVRSGLPRMPPEILTHIQKLSDTEFKVDRQVIDKILENQAALMATARIVPERKNGKVLGVRLFRIRPDSLLATLGLKNGDRLEAINGFNLSSPEKALEAYARLRTASNLNVRVNRGGRPVSIDYRIQ